MIVYPDYKTATNEAYRVITERDCFSIETNVFGIAENMKNCRVFSYAAASFFTGKPRETLLSASEYGFSIKKADGNRIIYYNEAMPLYCIRFTLAHEIGHAVLGHQDEGDSVAEKEANCFARNLLCPVPIAKALELGCENDYISVFNVGYQMASVSLKWRSSDSYYIKGEYRSALEDKLYAYNLGYESMTEFERYVYA